METRLHHQACSRQGAGQRPPFLIPTILPPTKKCPVKSGLSSTIRDRYNQAHREHFEREYPAAWKDGHYFAPDIPPCNSANSLTLFITKYLTFKGHRATRINVQGFLEKGAEVQPSGTSLVVNKWRKSSTRKGTADISATIHGRACQLEIKFGKDRASEAQLKEQVMERKAGGVYEFISTVEQFFEWYDKFVLAISRQSSIFD